MKLSLGITATAFTSYYFILPQFQTQSNLLFQNSQENLTIIRKLSPYLNFVPTFYLPTAFLQLAYFSYIRKIPDIKPFRECLITSDNGQICIDWVNQNNPDIICIMLHGLTGGSECEYMRDMAISLSKEFSVVCFNHRGVSDCELMTDRYHHHGDIEDFKLCVDHIRKQHPNAILVGVGISMGANHLIKYLGTVANHPFKVGVSIANPFDLLQCIYKISDTKNIMYDQVITTNFKNLLLKNIEFFKRVQNKYKIDLNKGLNCNSSFNFDSIITYKVSGFKSLFEMYKQISCVDELKHISIPVLFLNSRDDPIIDVIPRDEIIKQKKMIMIETQRGGHIEWFENFGSPDRWSKKVVNEYIKNALEIYN